jgi:hypothetical protein
MTVNTDDITSGPYIGNGIGSTFSYDFRVDDESQLTVYETDDEGNQTTLTLTTDYTVAGVGDDDGGIITRVAGNLPTDYEWYIRSNYLETQLTAFASQGGFFPDVHEKAMDKLTFLIQQLFDRWVKRSIHLSDSDSSAESADMSLPTVAGRASQFLGFDAEGSPIAVGGSVTSVPVSTFMATVLDDVNAAAAAITLEVLPLKGGTLTGVLGLAKGADIVSEAALFTTAGFPTDGNYLDVTGTTTITSLLTSGHIGTVVKLHFGASLTLTYDAADLVLPGGVNITTASGDEAEFVEYATGDWICTNYSRASGNPVVLQSASLTAEGGVELATDAEVKTGTDPTRVAPIHSMVQHEGMCKGWINFNGSGTIAINDSFNVASIADDGVGLYTVNWDSNFASADYAVAGMAVDNGSEVRGVVSPTGSVLTATAVSIKISGTASTVFDSAIVTVIAMGDLA